MSDLCPHSRDYGDCIPCNAVARGISEEEMAHEFEKSEKWKDSYNEHYDQEQAEEQVNELIERASRLRRGCSCEHDFRCGNCDNIIVIIDLARSLKNPGKCDSPWHYENDPRDDKVCYRCKGDWKDD